MPLKRNRQVRHLLHEEPPFCRTWLPMLLFSGRDPKQLFLSLHSMSIVSSVPQDEEGISGSVDLPCTSRPCNLLSLSPGSACPCSWPASRWYNNNLGSGCCGKTKGRKSCEKTHQSLLHSLRSWTQAQTLDFRSAMSYIVGVSVPSHLLRWSWLYLAGLISWPDLRHVYRTHWAVADPGYCHQTCLGGHCPVPSPMAPTHLSLRNSSLLQLPWHSVCCRKIGN